MFTPNLVVFSHLRWSFVHQRPQHLLGRLAGSWRVSYIEEPKFTEGRAHVEVIDINEHLTVLVPHTPIKASGFHDDQLAVLKPLLDEILAQRGIDQTVAWLYTPMALPLALGLDPVCIVYDCMDELSGFKDAPRQLLQRESALMKQADLVLTGGPSLYEARRCLHSNVHCLPSSVDAVHFSGARLDPASSVALEVHALQGPKKGPRLGYFGVIDERMDTDLIAAVADQHPDWQIMMVGPIVKIDPATVPQRTNIDWLGMQSYESLPHFLSSWDVCLMPFALNESTRFISPTKTLEYMAGGRPVVSTAVNDVLTLYGSAVEIAYTHDAFVAACEQLLNHDSASQNARSSEMARLVAAGSWGESAMRIDELLRDAREAAVDARLLFRKAIAVSLSEPKRFAAGRADPRRSTI